jgi:hypothetical protein
MRYRAAQGGECRSGIAPRKAAHDSSGKLQSLGGRNSLILRGLCLARSLQPGV